MQQNIHKFLNRYNWKEHNLHYAIINHWSVVMCHVLSGKSLTVQSAASRYTFSQFVRHRSSFLTRGTKALSSKEVVENGPVASGWKGLVDFAADNFTIFHKIASTLGKTPTNWTLGQWTWPPDSQNLEQFWFNELLMPAIHCTHDV